MKITRQQRTLLERLTRSDADGGSTLLSISAGGYRSHVRKLVAAGLADYGQHVSILATHGPAPTVRITEAGRAALSQR